MDASRSPLQRPLLAGRKASGLRVEVTRSSSGVTLPAPEGCITPQGDLSPVYRPPAGSSRTQTGLKLDPESLKLHEGYSPGQSHRRSRRDFWLPATLSVAFGVFSVVPYTMLLDIDRSSPLFINFVLHVAIVCRYLPQARQLFSTRRLPMKHILSIVVCGYAFVYLKSDAFTRLPASVCMILLNMRMVVAALVQTLMFRQTYSASQLCGVCLTTAGVTFAGWCLQGQRCGTESSSMHELLVGSAEIILALAALNLLSIRVKRSFDRYGECKDEVVFFQHLISLPLFLCQWNQLAPCAHRWMSSGDCWCFLLLAANIAFSFGARSSTVLMAGRAPNNLVVQLIQTAEKFCSGVTTALTQAPPYPPPGFWGGSVVLFVGMIQFLTASEEGVQGEQDQPKHKD
eukprot:TRINITY_DN60357_c0_g1_i1.p1 TRINITY_DN60357_c0_g1~~TRINITY_DN60357_c0_g1_i1.p1  ORF type:complete len:400 (-),score=35.99 TRINITY_DN60357_c0_g1_i1:182-1381(-)